MPRRSGRFGRHRCLHHQAARAGIDDTETAQRDQRQRLHGFLGAGRIVAEGGVEPGVIIAEIDPAEVAAARARTVE